MTTDRLTAFALAAVSGDDDRGPHGEQPRFELFRSRDGRAFADVCDDAIRQTWPVRSKQFELWLARRYFATMEKIATPRQLKTTINQFEAEAQDGGTPVREVFRRVGEFGERLYLDLADETWSAVEIDASGWRVVRNPPVRFERTPAMLPLSAPEDGGSLDMLRLLVNLGDEHDFFLAVAWLLAALRRNIAKPIMAIRGGEGSAKSSLVEILRGLIDPHDPPCAGLPRTDPKLQATAAVSYVQAYDNVSGLTVSMSDALCRFVTGGSNQPVIINGISGVITRPDLADRCLFLDCAPIPDAQRRTQADIIKTFADTRPQILGVLLDAVIHGLRNQDNIEVAGLPRMADFALAVTACETKFWPAGTFKAAYEANRAEAVETLIGSDPVTAAVRLLVARQEFWEGPASDLDGLLRAISGHVEDAKNWPAEPRLLANRLRDLAPSLLKIGIAVTFHRSGDRNRTRLISISANGPVSAGGEVSPQTPNNSASAASEPMMAAVGAELCNDAAGGDDGSVIPSTMPEPQIARELTMDAADADVVDKSEPPAAASSNGTPQRADAADAGIKNKSIEFISGRRIGQTYIPVFRHRKHGKFKKPGGSRRPK